MGPARRLDHLLLLPATLWLLVAAASCRWSSSWSTAWASGRRSGGYAAGFTLANYANLPARLDGVPEHADPGAAGHAAALCSRPIPLAYWLAVRCPQQWRLFLLVLVIVPFWTSLLIRTYAWIFILGGRGCRRSWPGSDSASRGLINTPFAVLLGIVYAYLPLMVFPIYVSLEKLDQRLLEASADLYAAPWRTFLQVTLPLSLPGVATGSMLVFILLMGEFLIPALLGGGKVFFIGNALVDLFLQSRNWPFGAAVSPWRWSCSCW